MDTKRHSTATFDTLRNFNRICLDKSIGSEAILDVRFDRRNFYNKMKRIGMLEQMDETVNPSQKKEAFLFRFNKAKYEELKQKGFRLEF